MPVVPITQRDDFGVPDHLRPSQTHMLMATGATMRQTLEQTGTAENIEQLKPTPKLNSKM